MHSLALSPYSVGPITMDHENTLRVKAYSASPSMLGRGHSLVEPQGSVGRHGSPFTSKKFRSVYMPPIFILNWPLALQMGLARNKFVEKNETRRHCGMYFIAKILKSDIASKKAVYGIQNLSNGL